MAGKIITGPGTRRVIGWLIDNGMSTTGYPYIFRPDQLSYIEPGTEVIVVTPGPPLPLMRALSQAEARGDITLSWVEA